MKNFSINDTTWYIGVDYFVNESQLIKFIGKSDRAELPDINQKIENLIISFHLYEIMCSVDSTDWLKETINFSEQIFSNLKHIYIFYENAQFSHQKIHTRCTLHTIKLNYYLLQSTTTLSKFNNWNFKNKKTLFMIGDARSRPHRFPILYEFYKNNSLHLLEYSLNLHYHDDHLPSIKDTDFTWLINYINYIYNEPLNKDSFYELYKKLCRDIKGDQFFSEVKKIGVMNASLHVYPPCYDEISLCLVAESQFQKIHCSSDFSFSEKIWKPILSGRPYVIPSRNDVAYYTLEKLGFKTFLNYTNFSNKVDYDYFQKNNDMYKPITIYKHAKLTYNRVCSFLNNMGNYENEIQKDIEYNMNHWKKLSNCEWDKLFNNCLLLNKIEKTNIITLFGLRSDNFIR